MRIMKKKLETATMVYSEFRGLELDHGVDDRHGPAVIEERKVPRVKVRVRNCFFGVLLHL